MIAVVKYLTSGWRGILASAGFIISAELWHREELRLAGIRAVKTAENATKESASSG